MYNLKIGSHNIQGGAAGKLKHYDLISLVSKFDIYCIQECWIDSSVQVISMPGYEVYRSLRTKGNKKRVFGGCLVFVKDELHNRHVQKRNSKYEDLLWVWLDGKFFDLPTDVYLCCAYIPHEKSVIHEERGLDPYKILAEETAAYQKKGQILYMGDFNSRTGTIIENWDHVNYLTDPIPGTNMGTTESYGVHDFSNRHSRDKSDNLFGSKLIKLCETLGLVILNGRTTGDASGRYTYHSTRGSSVIDYGICSLSLYKHIQSFVVEDCPWYSDHSPISIIFKSHRIHELCCTLQNTDGTPLEEHYSYSWNDQSATLFENAMKGRDIIMECENLSHNMTRLDINTVVTRVTGIIKQAADSSCDVKTTCGGGVGKIKKSPIPLRFRNSLKFAKSHFRYAQNSYKANTGDFSRRLTMVKCRKKLKDLIYLIDRYNKHDKIMKISKLEKKDPKAFWAGIRKLGAQKVHTSKISPIEWIDHFKKLLNIKHDNVDSQFVDYVETSLPLLEREAIPNDDGINDDITSDEFTKALQKMKNNKAAGPDMIRNEMIKRAGPSFHKVLLQLFNKLLRNDSYPDKWKTSIISTIFKSGDVHNPGNYRGVAVANSMHKLFTIILNKRLTDYLTLFGKCSPNQNGFMQGMRTDDNLFILYSLIHKYVRRESKHIYAAFIDFRKFFDIINRDLLMYKLLRNNITGDMYFTIKNMYKGTNYSIKTDRGLTEVFESKSGVLQGCTLSPTLSNLFQNDLHEIFYGDTDGLQLDNDTTINSISWADDLLLFSSSHKGLQTCLDRLNQYCRKWGLSINTSKTKAMLFRKGLSILEGQQLSIGGVEIEWVNNYKYLGCIVSSDGKLHKAMADRLEKATKAVYSIRNAISHYENISTTLANTLFDKQISPILLYGSAMWILPEVNRYAKVNLTGEMNWFAYKQVSKIFHNATGREIPFEKTSIPIDREAKHLFVKFMHWRDKEELIKVTNETSDIGCTVSDHDAHMHKGSNIDKVQGKFLKFSLGLSKFASTSAVLRELGQFPITLKGIRLALMYYYRLKNGISHETHPLLSAAFSCMQQTNHPWLENVEFCFAKYGLGNIYNNISNLHRGYVKSKIIQRLHDAHAQENSSYLADKEYLNTFNTCIKGSEYRKSEYLSLIESPTIRSTYARLRLNCSKLSPSPYSKISSECQTCGSLLDWEHCLIQCPQNRTERDKFMRTISVLCPNFVLLTNEEKFRAIMNLQFKTSNENRQDIIPIAVSFVMKTYKAFLSGLWST